MFLRSPRGPLVRLIMFAAAAGLFVVAYYWGNRYQYGVLRPPTIEGVSVRPAISLPPFELQDASGAPFSSDDLQGRWTLIAFGDLAQARGHLTVSRLLAVHNALADERKLAPQLQLALAARGEPSELTRDFARLSRALRILSGEPESIEPLRIALGESEEEPPGEPGEGAPIYQIDPRGRLVALYLPSQSTEAIAADLRTLATRRDALPEPADD
jgi:hypothetical protein